MSRRAGFTLIELLVVIVIIGILATIGVVSYSQAMINARDNKRRTDMENVRQALVMYRSETGEYPCQNNFDSMMKEVKNNGYWSGAVPVDPKSPTTDYEYESNPAICSSLGDRATSFVLRFTLEGKKHQASNPQELSSP